VKDLLGAGGYERIFNKELKITRGFRRGGTGVVVEKKAGGRKVT